MTDQRSGEQTATHFRSQRIQRVNGGWYIAVREPPGLQGPFDTQDEADMEVSFYLRQLGHRS